ncbi:MAG: hypothetical protein O7H41_10325 [Planctomycetota bacterium]|nr:hypothetical protein [Planctomycetota bacterium]
MDYSETTEAVAELGRPWKTLVGEIPDLTEKLEQEFRFGQRVTFFNGSYRMGGNIKGGTSSIWYPVGEPAHNAYLAWRERDGLPYVEDRAAFEKLQDLLDRSGTELLGSGRDKDGAYQDNFGNVYRIAFEIFSFLPFEHLSGKEISAIQLGGWGPDSAKASAYDDACVMMYDFAVKGARRTFAGLLLHELGHAHERRLPKAERRRLAEVFQVLSKEDALIGVEFLLDGKARKIYQRASINEFLAESYLIYVSHGNRLRQEMNGGAGDSASAWSALYNIFRDSFGGLEYA